MHLREIKFCHIAQFQTIIREEPLQSLFFFTSICMENRLLAPISSALALPLNDFSMLGKCNPSTKVLSRFFPSYITKMLYSEEAM